MMGVIYQLNSGTVVKRPETGRRPKKKKPVTPPEKTTMEAFKELSKSFYELDLIVRELYYSRRS